MEGTEIVEVAIGDYKISSGRENLYTRDLRGGVGVALFGENCSRGLAHIHCGMAKDDFDKETGMAEETLDKFLNKFQDSNLQAIIVATPVELNENNTYQNSMLNFVRGYLENHRVSIKEIDDAQSMSDKEKVHSKGLVLAAEEARVTYWNRRGKRSEQDARRIPLG